MKNVLVSSWSFPEDLLEAGGMVKSSKATAADKSALLFTLTVCTYYDFI